MRKMWPGLSLLPLALLFGVWALPKLPDQVITHWGPGGQPDGWSTPGTLVFLLPGIMLVVAVILSVAPRIDPKRANFALHSSAYWLIANLVLGFLAVVHVVVVGINLGWSIDPMRVIGGGVGALLAVIGNVLTRVRSNWIFGIRTPWTLSSERSWRETHRVGGYSFVAYGLLTMAAALVAPKATFVVLIAGGVATSLFSVVYSYIVWKNDPATKAVQ